LWVDEVGRVDAEKGGFNIHRIPGEMLAGHLGGEDAYTFKRECGGECLAGVAVFKRDIIAREVLDVLLDFEIGAGILVSGGGHYGMEWNGMESNGMESNGMEFILLYYIIYPKLKQCPQTFLDFIADGVRDFFPVLRVTKAFVE
jgi:hypothetical protein